MRRESRFSAATVLGTLLSRLVVILLGRRGRGSRSIRSIVTRGRQSSKVANHHFFPSLVAPADCLCGIGIGQIARGIIKVGRTHQQSTLGNFLGLGKLVAQLPVEVVPWNIQQDLTRSVRILSLVAE